MTVKVLEETRVVRGTVVQCPDMYDNAQQTGYITGRSGDVFATSERLDFSLGDMWVVMTDSLGNYRGRWRAYPVSGKPKAFQAAADTFDLNIYDRKMYKTPAGISSLPTRNLIPLSGASIAPNLTVTILKPSHSLNIQTRFIRNTQQ